MSPILKRFPEHGKRWLMTVISFVVLCAAFAALAFELTKKPVTVILDGEKQTLNAHAETVGELLSDLGVDVGEHDAITPGLDTELEAGMTVNWQPAVQVKWAHNGEEETVWTTAETVGDWLTEQGIDVDEDDHLSPAADTPVSDGLEIAYASAYTLDLNVAGEETTVTATDHSMTVGEFLEKRGIPYDDRDKVKPSPETSLTEAGNITVTYIEKKKVTDVVPVDYDVVKKQDDSLAKGKKKVLASGKKGKVKKTYTVTLENGEEVSRKLIDTETKRESEDRVVAVGTKASEQPSRGGSDGGDGKKRFYAHSTAYTTDCGGCSGVTATGMNLNANPDVKVIAVDPDVIPLGSRVHVEGYGTAVAADTGGAVDGRTIDVFFPTKAKAHAWGQRKVLVKILD